MKKLRNNVTFSSCVPPVWEYTLYIEQMRHGVTQSNVLLKAVFKLNGYGGAWYGGKEKAFPEALKYCFIRRQSWRTAAHSVSGQFTQLSQGA